MSTDNRITNTELRELLDRGQRTVIVIDRKEALNQFSIRISDLGVKHSIIKKGQTTDERYLKVQIASVSSLLGRLIALPDGAIPPESLQFKLVIIDDPHEEKAGSYNALTGFYPDAFFFVPGLIESGSDEHQRVESWFARKTPSAAIERGTKAHQETESRLGGVVPSSEQLVKIGADAKLAAGFSPLEIKLPKSIDLLGEDTIDPRTFIILVPSAESNGALPLVTTHSAHGDATPDLILRGCWLELGKLPVGIADTSDVIEAIVEHTDELVGLNKGYQKEWTAFDHAGQWRVDEDNSAIVIEETIKAIRDAIDTAIEGAPMFWSAEDLFGQTSKRDLFGEDFNGSKDALDARASELVDDTPIEIVANVDDVLRFITEAWRDWSPDEDDVRTAASESVEAFLEDPADFADVDESYWREACREDQAVKDWPDAIWPVYRDEIIKCLSRAASGRK